MSNYEDLDLGIALNCSSELLLPESNIALFLWSQRVLHLIGPHLEWKLHNRQNQQQLTDSLLNAKQISDWIAQKIIEQIRSYYVYFLKIGLPRAHSL